MSKQLRDLTESQGILILSKYSKNLICRICCHLFQKPMRLHPCGHTFCQQCVQHDFIRICPRCEQTIEIIQNDLLGRKLVSDIKVKCTKEGCPWKGNYQQFFMVHKDRCLLDLEQNSWMGKIYNIAKKYDQYIVKKYEEKGVKKYDQKLNPEKQQQIKIQQILSQKDDNENIQVQIEQNIDKIQNLQVLSHQDNKKVQNIQQNNKNLQISQQKLPDKLLNVSLPQNQNLYQEIHPQMKDGLQQHQQNITKNLRQQNLQLNDSKQQ